MDRQNISGPGGISEEDAFATFSRAQVAMVLTNPSLPDNPVVYVNKAFERVTGFSRDSAIGRNCRFLQGPDTDASHTAALREAIREARELSVDIRNYRADGSPFTNRLLISPVHDSQGDLTYFLGIQKVLSDADAQMAEHGARDAALREIQHRVKNHLAMIVGLIRIQSREANARAERIGTPSAFSEYDTLARRVESLQLLYEELNLGAGSGYARDQVNIGPYLSRVASAIAHLDGRAGIAVSIDAASARVPVEVATHLGLVVSEIMTNALQHAFAGRSEGRLDLRVTRIEDGGICVRITDDGAGIPDHVEWPDMDSLGSRIVLGLVDGLGATLHVDRPVEGGTIVTLDVARAMLDK